MNIQPVKLVKARKKFSHFLIWSAVSYNLLSGNIIILYVLKLGAGNFLIGLISSFVYIAQVMPLIGRKFVSRTGMVRLMAGSWFVRYMSMVPILFVPLLLRAKAGFLALGLCVFCLLLFHLSRGIGITSYNPIVGSLTTDTDRGAYFSRLALIFQSGTIVVTLAVALLLGEEAPLFIYTLFIGGGILTGIISSLILFRVPEPCDASTFDTKSIGTSFISAFSRQGFKNFMIPHLAAYFVIGMTAPFLIVFMKQVYFQTDRTIVYFLVIGSVGGIVMSLLSGFVMDRLGAKPLYFLYTLIITIMLIIVFIMPEKGALFLFWLYAGVIFFLFRLGESGLNNAGNVYFFSVINEEERLNLGVVYQIAYGLAASAGSVLGGIYLDSIRYISGFSIVSVFRFFFGSLILLSVIILFLVMRMESRGAYSIKDAVSMIFSPRDWKAISLLNRLKSSGSVMQERDMIKSLGEKPSRLSKTELLARLKSPRFSVRAQTLNALSGFPINKEIETALIHEVKYHHFTTAFLAAKIIGKLNIKKGIPVLRNALDSDDFFLCGKAMVALARLHDSASIPVIEQLLLRSENPRIIIHAVLALELFKHMPSIVIIIKKIFILSGENHGNKHSFIRDELLLSIAGIIGMDSFFYHLYQTFRKNKAKGLLHLSISYEKHEKKNSLDKNCNVKFMRLLTGKINRSERQKVLHFLCMETGHFRHAHALAYLSEIFTIKLFNYSDELFFLLTAYMVWYLCYSEQV
ncbi:MAG: hypothetical protein JXB88_24000 [Spirochaetales bacterium]|nr:hypothetical protein [Spirochaetales bacterium]